MSQRKAFLLFVVGFGLFLDRPATAYRLSCGSPSSLDLCGAPPSSAVRYSERFVREETEYNSFQRLAGMIADRMEAGSLGSVKFKFKILLNS